MIAKRSGKILELQGGIRGFILGNCGMISEYIAVYSALNVRTRFLLIVVLILERKKIQNAKMVAQKGAPEGQVRPSILSTPLK